MKEITLKIIVLTFGLIVENFSFCQQRELEIPLAQDMGGVYSSAVLINEANSLVLIDVEYTSELARKSHFYLIDLKKFTLLSQFHTKRWTYLHDAYFYNDSLLYISFGIRLRSKYYIYDIFSGERIAKQLAKKSPKGDAFRAKDNHIKFNHNLSEPNQLVFEKKSIYIDMIEKKLVIESN